MRIWNLFFPLCENIILFFSATKKINSMSYFDIDDFIRNAQRYVKASKENRIFCVIKSVSSTGMSRVMQFAECSKGKERYNFLNFWALFKALGYTETDKGFRISGCGMDMVFATHYDIILKLCHLGFISDSECRVLSQNTPSCF